MFLNFTLPIIKFSKIIHKYVQTVLNFTLPVVNINISKIAQNMFKVFSTLLCWRSGLKNRFMCVIVLFRPTFLRVRSNL